MAGVAKSSAGVVYSEGGGQTAWLLAHLCPFGRQIKACSSRWGRFTPLESSTPPHHCATSCSRTPLLAVIRQPLLPRSWSSRHKAPTAPCLNTGLKRKKNSIPSADRAPLLIGRSPTTCITKCPSPNRSHLGAALHFSRFESGSPSVQAGFPFYLYSYGLYNHAQYGYGLYSCGQYSYGLYKRSASASPLGSK